MLHLMIGKDDDVPSFRAPRALLLRLFEIVMRGERRLKLKGQVNLVFVGDQRIRELNRLYRGKDKPTDVLSFNLDEPVETEAVFGELYISIPTAQRQASENDLSLTRELTRLTCHGLLHLLGYDHERSVADERLMFERQELYLQKVGV
ncbi:MAG TPA: rRNA maturation RNase YbeY [candidate division Zixibacteria bacterium]|nr:rRNA maturation RNase YbeY [candidate division Zixibacteria bacterium]